MSVRLIAESLEVARGGRTLFRDLSFEAEPGAFVEIRGPNGAGKTSLLRALAGYLQPRAGTIRFEGAEEQSLAVHFLGHQNGLKGAASANAHVGYWAGLFGGARRDVLERVGLTRAADLPARVLSQGQARRLAVARLLTAPRPVWLLDEPAAGLDSDGRGLLGELIAEHCKSGGLALAALHEPLGVAASHTVNLGGG